jgi:two-component system nitrogen regulation sensor histidine kinase NtrY
MISDRMGRKLEWYLLLQLILLVLTVFLTTFCLLKGWYGYAALSGVLLSYTVAYIYRHQIKIYQELEQLAEAIRYKDFSRDYREHNPSPAVQTLRKGLNEINKLFKEVLIEKETQHQYLHKILEMIETGVLSYEKTSGEVLWMNESLKKMMQVPDLKTIHSFARRNNGLYQQLMSIKPGNSTIVTVAADKNTFKILLSSSSFIINGKMYNLIAFQNIDEAVNETETKAWQKLLGVLTHEIMNSIAPIASLADTMKTSINAIKPSILSDSSLADLIIGADTIKRRSEGLIKFAETYKSLSKISKPDLKIFYIRDLFENIFNLMQPTLTQKDIELEIILKDPDLTTEADINLIEQVLINLIVNAVEAVKDVAMPKIILLSDRKDKNMAVIKVIDNGTGIPAVISESIFIPFFSTKKNGSGIGLTLCKQIMMLHNGSLSVQSKEGSGTAFSLQFQPISF